MFRLTIGVVVFGLLLTLNCRADDELSPLLEQLKSEARSERVDALKTLAEHDVLSDVALRHVIPHLTVLHGDEREAAVHVFECMGSRARGVLPELVSLEIDVRLRSDWPWSDAHLAIAAVAGGRARSLIMQEVSDYCEIAPHSDHMERAFTVRLPDWIGRSPRPLREVMVPDPGIRRLVEDLSHDNPDVRWTALRGLELALQEDEFRQLTVASALDPDPRVRSRVMEGLWNAGADGERAAALAYAIYHRLSNVHIREQLARGQRGDVLFPQIAEVLVASPVRMIQLQRCIFYGKVDTPTPRQIQYLTTVLGSEAPDVRFAAERTITHHRLWHRGGVVDSVRSSLAAADSSTQASAMRAARHLGVRLTRSMPRLIELATTGDSSEQRSMAMRTIGYLPDPTPDLVEVVRGQLLMATTDLERAECIRTLGAFGEASSSAIPTVFGYLHDPALRRLVINTLQQILPPDHPMQQVLERIYEGVLVQELGESLSEIIDGQKALREATFDAQVRELEEPGRDVR